LRTGTSCGDLQENSAHATSGLQDPVARPRRDGCRQQGRVHARAIAPCRLKQADLSAQKGVFNNVGVGRRLWRGWGCDGHAA
jgi:hypothetical protein